MAEGLHLLLCLNLARGHVAALVRTIRHFYGNLPCSVVRVFHSGMLDRIADFFWFVLQVFWGFVYSGA